MESLNATLLPLVQKANAFLADYILIFLLVGAGLWFTVKTGFVQRYIGQGLKSIFGSLSLKGDKQESGMSSFQAVATAIAAQVGTGNIVGASGAILTGGPGAIFWMWVIAFLGMATIYAEATLAVKTRKENADGSIAGGSIPYVTLEVLPKIRGMDNNIYNAALDLGCPPAKAFLKVVIPQIKPGIVTGFIMAFTLSLDDFIISYFNSGSTVQTLSVTIFSMTKKPYSPKINALSTLLFVTILILLVTVNLKQMRADSKKKGAKK